MSLEVNGKVIPVVNTEEGPAADGEALLEAMQGDKLAAIIVKDRATRHARCEVAVQKALAEFNCHFETHYVLSSHAAPQYTMELVAD